MRHFADGLTWVLAASIGYIYIDTSGNIAIGPLDFSDIDGFEEIILVGSFSEGLAYIVARIDGNRHIGYITCES
jgi:hypothetical protein